MLEDRVLLWKLKRGNRDALRNIYNKYKRDMLSLSNALLRDLNAAEDVVHDVLISFVQSLDEFKLTGSLKGYLLTCVANLSRDRIRAKKRQPHGLNGADTQASNYGTPVDTVILAEQLHRLRDAMAMLPYEQREAIVLHLQAGRTFKEIAGLLQTPIGTIQSRYRYGLDKLRALLNSEIDK
jgi:RNA polymerase sigma-70 factor (ECF subfamily)